MRITRPRPSFTSFEQKAAWLQQEAERLRRAALSYEHSGAWHWADEAEAARAALLREHDAMLDDAMCSIPRHQRYA